MNISHQMRKRFIKDMDIPMQVVKDPYFDYFLNIFNPYFDSMNKFQLLEKALKFYSEDEFNKILKEIRENAIDHVNRKHEYAEMQRNWGDAYISESVVKNVNKSGLYSHENADKAFISIDMRQANFNSLRHFDPEIVDGKASYEDFISQFIEDENIEQYIHVSKRFRQIIFGNLNPKRQQIIQKYIMSRIAFELVHGDIIVEDILSFSSDEIIVTHNGTPEEILETIALLGMESIIKVERFILRHLGTDNFKFFVKEFVGKTEIKGVNSAYMPEVIKFLEGTPVINEDRLFFSDGRLCKFENSLF